MWGILSDERTGLSRLLGRPRCRWEDNMAMDLMEIGRGGMDWIDLAQNRHQKRAFVQV
jgi:hypothetical protein